MADNDIFVRTFDPVWRVAFRAAMSDGTPEEIAIRCAPALGEFLHKHGCPKFEEFRNLIQSVCLSADQAHLPFGGNHTDIANQAAQIALSCAGTVAGTTAQIQASVCEIMALEAQMCGPLHGNASETYSQRLCVAMTLAYFVDRLNCPEILARFETAAGGNAQRAMELFFDWRSELEGHLETTLLAVAAKLAADPTCKNVRVPKVRSPKRSASELMRLVLT